MSLLSIGTRGNDLFASDPAQMRVTTFSFDGDLVDSKRWRSEIPPTRSGAFLLLPNSPLVVFADGSALVRPNLVAMATAPAVGPSEDRLRIPLLRTDSMGTVSDTIAWEEPASTSVGIRRNGTVYSIVAPFEETSMTAVGRGGTGVVVASPGVGGQQGSSRATLVRVEPTGDTAFSRAFDFPAVPLTAEHVGRVLAETDVFPGGSDEAPSGLEFEDELRRNGLIPQYLPPFAGLFVGQGRIDMGSSRGRARGRRGLHPAGRGRRFARHSSVAARTTSDRGQRVDLRYRRGDQPGRPGVATLRHRSLTCSEPRRGLPFVP